MSDRTKTALEDAIAAHVADETPGAVVTGFVLIAANATPEDFDNGETGYWMQFPDRQPSHVSAGLVHCARRIIDGDMQEE